MRTGALAATSLLLCCCFVSGDTLAQAADLQRWDGTVVMTPPIIAAAVQQPPSKPGTTAKSIVSAEQRLVELVNQARLSHESLGGAQLAPLKKAELLDEVAETHAARMATAGFVSHCDPTTSELPADRLANAGYVAELAGESLVVGYVDPEEVLDALLQHPASLALVLSPQLREIGIGLAPDPNDVGNVALDLDQDCSGDLRVGAETTSHSRMPSAPHLWSALNREILDVALLHLRPRSVGQTKSAAQLAVSSAKLFLRRPLTRPARHRNTAGYGKKGVKCSWAIVRAPAGPLA